MNKNLTLRKKLSELLPWPLIALAITPLIVTNATLFPFIFGKTIFIRLCVVLFYLLLTAFLLLNGKLKKEHLDRLKNPIAVAIYIFVTLVLLSTVLGVNSYRSFFGDIERGEGLLTLLYMFSFYLGAILVFTKKHVSVFLKVTLLVGTAIILDTVFGFMGGQVRPAGSFIGNPSFIAAYMFFVLFAGLFIYKQSKYESKIWKPISLLVIALSILSIFVTETRGAMVGIVVGGLAFAFHQLFLKDKSSRRLVWLSIGSIIGVALVFIATIGNPFWDNVPGFNRFARLSEGANDNVQTRLIAIGSSLLSVHPLQEGIMRTSLGWGPNNFGNAYNSHYNPNYIQYSDQWFDKAHNQFIDVLVTNGVLGLIGYLSIWFLSLFCLFRKMKGLKDYNESIRDLRNILAVSLFFVLGYSVQNLALFDQVTTLVPIFTFFAISTIYSQKNQDFDSDRDIHVSWPLKGVAILLTLFITIMFIWQTIIPYIQMRIFTNTIMRGDATVLEANLERIINPYTYVQMELRSKLQLAATGFVGSPGAENLVIKSVSYAKEAVDKEPNSQARFSLAFGSTITALNKFYLNEKGYNTALQEGEKYLRQALASAPNRQEIILALANNLTYQGKFEESYSMLSDMVSRTPGLSVTEYQRSLIMSPHQFIDSAEALETLRSTLLESKIPLKFVYLNNIRESYLAYMIQAHRARNREDLIFTMKRSVEIEKIIDQFNQSLLDQGLIKELPISLMSRQQDGLNTFILHGWDAVKVI